MSIRKIKKAVSVAELIKEQDHAQNRVRNIQTELYERGEVRHEFHSPVQNHAFMKITPKLASKMLNSFNGGKGVKATNRSQSKVKAQQIATDIRDGNFHGYVSTIIFDEDGVLMDGQTRLQAILNAKTACHMHVIMGVPREGMMKIDIGRKRTNADRFRLSGKLGECSNNQARWYERLARFSCASVPSESAYGNGRPFVKTKYYLTDEAIEAELLRLEEPIHYMVENLSQKKPLQKLQVLVAIAQWWVEVDSGGEPQAEDAKRFYDDLMSGSRLTPGDPIFTLREKLLDTDWQKIGHNLSRVYEIGYGWTIHAINKHVHCDPLNRLTKRTVSFKFDLP
jgi:hypothetical protein